MKNLYAKVFAMLGVLLFLSGQLWAQDLDITGTVTSSEDGSGIPGVNILVVGTSSGATTDINGTYKLKAASGATLEYRFLGFTTERRVVGASLVMDVVLKEEVRTLKEAVVIGYGSLSKKDVTGAIGTVQSKDFQAGQITSPDQLIQGKVAGVQITAGGGAPGGGSQIRIRGGASLYASNDPLYVIDGVPVDNGGIAGAPNPLSLINPSDIETFTVLKDASATAIYGSRASNGVIIITTKKGAIGMKPSFTFSTQNSIGIIAKKLNVLSGDSVRAIVNRLGNEAQKKLLGTANTDWQKQIYQAAYTTDNNLSYAGAYGKMPFRISGGWLTQQGLLKTDLMNRQTLGVNLNPTLLDGDLKIGLNLKGSRSSNEFANTGAIGAATGFDPTQPIYEVDSNGVRSPRFNGYKEWRAGNSLDLLAGRNPVGQLYDRSNVSEVFRSIGNVTLDYTLPFFRDLRANLNLGYDAANGSGDVIVNDSAATNFFAKGNRSHYKQTKQSNLIEFYLNYSKTLPALKSRMDLMAGTAYQSFQSTNYSYQRHTYRPYLSADSVLVDTLPDDKPPVFAFDKPENRLASFYGRFNYSFMEKLNLTVSLRADGSSRFAPNRRWGYFPSAALAYRLTEETFMKNQKVLTQLKLRAGWGQTGQQDIGANYSYQSYFSTSSLTAQYQFGDSYYQMARPSAYDPNIKWETTTTYNAGADFGFMKDRITASVDLYFKKTNDLLNVVSTPAGANFGTQVLTNVGNVENRGIEIQVNTVPVLMNDFRWDLGFNVTANDNKITKLTAIRDSLDPGTRVGGIAGGTGNTVQIYSVGYPVNSFFVFKQVYENGKPVEGVYQDLNGDGILNQSDMYHFRQPSPRIYYGISSNFSYKGAFLGFVIRGSEGNYVYNNVESNGGTYQSILAQSTNISNASANVLDTKFTGVGANADYRLLSDYYIRKASFVRMDNLTFGYDFGDVAKNFGLKVSGTIQNVFVMTDYSGIDPEIPSGIDNTYYPRPRTFVLGLMFTVK